MFRVVKGADLAGILDLDARLARGQEVDQGLAAVRADGATLRLQSRGVMLRLRSCGGSSEITITDLAKSVIVLHCNTGFAWDPGTPSRSDGRRRPSACDHISFETCSP